MNYNKAILVGNITRDPELKALPSGISVCNFSIATNKYYTDKDGNKQQTVEYHNIVIFGKMAETTAQYMSKGSQILIEGRIQTRSWEDQKTGEKKYRTEIVAESVQFGNKPSGGENRSNNNQEDDDWDDEPTDNPAETINPDDIPF